MSAYVGSIFLLSGCLCWVARMHARALGAKDTSDMCVLGICWMGVGGLIVIVGSHT